jgi:hypothetical protein
MNALLFAALVLGSAVLGEGSSWTYSAAVSWTVPGTSEVRSATIPWKCWVERSATSGARTVAVVRGYPAELAWYQPGQEPGYTVVVHDGTGLYVAQVDGPKEAADRFQRALRGEPVGEQLYRYPLKAGDCLRPPDEPAREDRLYCWQVESRKGTRWTVSQRTNPSHEILDFDARGGIIRYQYAHHGTVSTVDARLTKGGD